MSLRTNQRDPYRATQPITCYKSVLVIYSTPMDGKELIPETYRCFAPLFGFKYRLRRTYRVRRWLKKCFEDNTHSVLPGTPIGQGFHAFKRIEDVHHPVKRCVGGDSWAYTELRSVVARCVIPKGALYFENERELVANRIRIEELMFNVEEKNDEKH